MLRRMEIDFESLARQVRDELDAYVVPEHSASLGTRCPTPGMLLNWPR